MYYARNGGSSMTCRTWPGCAYFSILCPRPTSLLPTLLQAYWSFKINFLNKSILSLCYILGIDLGIVFQAESLLLGGYVVSAPGTLSSFLLQRPTLLGRSFPSSLLFTKVSAQMSPQTFTFCLKQGISTLAACWDHQGNVKKNLKAQVSSKTNQIQASERGPGISVPTSFKGMPVRSRGWSHVT